jgi:tetratricopeptide (TPR) repeat protein
MRMVKRAKPGRNEHCPCGSGRKFKACCAIADGGALTSATVERTVRLAEGLLEAGRYDEAIHKLREAARVAPNDAAICYNLGSACLVTRRFPDALHFLLRALSLQPNFARTHYNLGMVMQEIGDPERALVAYRRAVTIAPEFAEAQYRTGDLQFESGLRDEARASYERAFAAAPNTALGLLSKAKALLAQDHVVDAEKQLREVIARDPSNAAAHLVLAGLLDDTGRFEDAATHFERSIAILPQQAAAYLGLVSSMRVTNKDRPLLTRILGRLEDADLGESKKMALHFAAGKALDDLGEYAGAIRHFDAANRIRRSVAPFDREETEQRVDQLIARFTREFLTSHSALGDDAETPILILGMPRSGTTLLERILTSHPSVAGGGELSFWRERGFAWANATGDRLDGESRALRGDYLHLLRSIAPRALRVTDKMPFNFFWVGVVHLLFPNARIIHSRRNPIDTCLSIFATPFATPRTWGFASDRGDLVWYYRQYVRLMDHWRSVLPADRLLDVDYENAAVTPEQVARRVIAFVGLEWNEACLNPERNPDVIRTASKWQARQPIYRSSVGRWRRYEPWLGELLELLSG